MILQSIDHHASCEAFSESTVHLTEDSPHHAKCQKLITFTGFNCTDTPKGHISLLICNEATRGGKPLPWCQLPPSTESLRFVIRFCSSTKLQSQLRRIASRFVLLLLCSAASCWLVVESQTSSVVLSVYLCRCFNL